MKCSKKGEISCIHFYRLTGRVGVEQVLYHIQQFLSNAQIQIRNTQICQTLIFRTQILIFRVMIWIWLWSSGTPKETNKYTPNDTWFVNELWICWLVIMKVKICELNIMKGLNLPIGAVHSLLLTGWPAVATGGQPIIGPELLFIHNSSMNSSARGQWWNSIVKQIQISRFS